MASLTKITALISDINILLAKKARSLEVKRTNAYFLIVLNGQKIIKAGLTMAKAQMYLEGVLEGARLAFSRKSVTKSPQKKNTGPPW